MYGKHAMYGVISVGGHKTKKQTGTVHAFRSTVLVQKYLPLRTKYA